MELLVLKAVKVEFLVLKGVRVELLLVLEGGEGGIPPCLNGMRVDLLLVLELVRVELLVLRGEGGTRYLGRDEGRTGVLVKPLRKTKTTRLILLPFKIVTGAVMTGMFLLVQIGI